jgi:hypothetical protein
MLHEIIVFLCGIDAKKAHHPNSSNTEEMTRWNIVNILQEKEG